MRGISFEETRQLFEKPYYLDRRSEVPEQFRAIGWVYGELFSVIFEIREDKQGEYYHIVTLWESTKEERRLYEKSC
ncbi:MAG: hypothetical protein H6618_10185 [Deltaproteobacteria bacterium]|nr:hypothetical protein [Deltaproteobacteria bacterium]